MNDERQEIRPAVIYCRVSSEKQVEEGHGLQSQEHRCREHAATKGYDVEAVFPDSVSGGGDFINRPGMVALLSYLDAQSSKSYVVIFDDLKRFARDTEFHMALRREFKQRGATIECLNFQLEDTPEGEFIETILAAQGALERKQNRRQVIQKMKARLEAGYWVFHHPIGLKYAQTKEHGKILVRDEPLASMIQEALEGFASGRLQSKAEVVRFLDSQHFPQNNRKMITFQRVNNILTQALYAGYIHHPGWDVPWLKAKHEGLISFDTFNQIQTRLRGRKQAPARPDLNEDFPLRGFVECEGCGGPLTAGWSKGKLKKYPYYLCGKKWCPDFGKSIPRAKVHEGFEDILESLQPSETLIELARDMFQVAWETRLSHARAMLGSIKDEIAKVEKNIAEMLERITDVHNPSVIEAYESRIEAMQKDRLVLHEKLKNGVPKRARREEYIEHALCFLSNPVKLWRSGDFGLQRLVLRLAFSERMVYSRAEGYRTPKISLPFKVLGDISGSKNELVGLGGLEPPRPKDNRF